MALPDFITFLSILVAVIMSLIPYNKYYLLKWNWSNRMIWFLSILYVVIMLLLIKADSLLIKFPTLKIFYFECKYLPSSNFYALLISLALIAFLVYKQFNGKLSTHKLTEITNYLQDLLTNKDYGEIVQIISTQNIISDLDRNAPNSLSIKIFKMLTSYEDFIQYIGLRKPVMFIRAITRYGTDQRYLNDFISHMLLSQEFRIEIESRTKSDGSLQFNDVYHKTALPIICESALLDFNDLEIINDLNNSVYYLESKLLSKYRISSVIHILKIKTQSTISDNLLLQYYRAFILKIDQLPVKVITKSHLYKLFE